MLNGTLVAEAGESVPRYVKEAGLSRARHRIMLSPRGRVAAPHGRSAPALAAGLGWRLGGYRAAGALSLALAGAGWLRGTVTPV